MRKYRLFAFLTIGLLAITACGSNNMKKINDGPIEIGVYDKYDLDTWMRPIWQGRVMHNETVMLLGPSDSAKLLHKPDEVLAVKDYGLETDFKLNEDYIIHDDGSISLTENTKVNYMDKETYYSSNPNSTTVLNVKVNGENKSIWYSEDIYKHQIAVTYTHSEFYEGFMPKARKDQFSNLISKLEKGEDVTFIFYGDSITYGCVSSGLYKKAPYTPTWSVMLTNYIAKQYGYKVQYINSGKPSTYNHSASELSFGDKGTIKYINVGVGGWTVAQGNSNFENYVKDMASTHGCDLFVLAFGMNDGSRNADYVQEMNSNMLDRLYASYPEAESLLVSTMVPNPEVVNGNWNRNQPQFEEKYFELADVYQMSNKHCAVSPMTSMSQSIYKTKRFFDCTANNVNHPSDFMVRLYAQVAYQVMMGEEYK